MNKLFLRVLGMVFLSAMIVSCAAGVSSSQQNTAVPTNSASGSSSTVVDIKISGFAFSPNTLTIKAGTEVRWTNLDNVTHDVTSTSGNELVSGSLSNGQTYTHVFNQAGTFAYHCGIHPTMTATIIVTP